MSATAVIRRSATVAATFVSMSCASAPGREIQTSVRVDPAPAATSPQPVATLEATPPALPQLGTGPGPALSSAPERRVSAIDVPAGTPIGVAVTQLGAKFGLNVSVDPNVRGTTQASLRNVTLNEALQQIVGHSGAQYQLQGNVLRVVPIRMETRSFTLDYVSLSRVGTMSTVVQRRLTGSSGGISAGTAGGLSVNNGGGGGGDVLTAQSIADVWQEIRIGLVGILSAGQNVRQQNGPGGTLDATGPPASSQAAASQAAAAAAGNGPQASNTQFADGSALIITPMSGGISVIAMPDKLDAAETFINNFQASVLRQVMIQAKIVEVQLERKFTAGIDWNLVTGSASSKFGITLSSDPTAIVSGSTGNINFKFTGGTTTINAIVNALSTQGDVNVLSNEQTSALNNQRAIFQVTTDQVFFSVTRTPLLGPTGGVASIQSSINAQQVSVGVVLDVLPQISADNILTMDIRPAVTSILDTTSISLSDGTSASAPVIARREGDTIARMRAGETMMIGGLVQTRKEHTTSGIPILMDIPWLGKLFRHVDDHTIRSELVVFLTPTIISSQPALGR